MDNCHIKYIKSTKFVVERELGKGNFGKVYLAKDTQNGVFSAVKEIRKDRLTKREEHYLTNEISILSNISHKNIAGVLPDCPYTQDEEFIYIFLEYCNGGDLSNLVGFFKNKSKIPEKLIKTLFQQIIEGLKFLHDNNVAHRDLKLENIMLHFPNSPLDLNDCIVKICDLGFAKKIETNIARTVLGSPAYMAPEIISNKNNPNWSFYDEKCDVWSLGIIFYLLNFLEFPFPFLKGENPFYIISMGEYLINKNNIVSLESVEVLNCMLRYDPQQRLSLSQIFNLDYFRKQSEEFKYINLSQEFENVLGETVKVDCKEETNLLNKLLQKEEVFYKSNSFSIDEINEEEIKVLTSNKLSYKCITLLPKGIKIIYNYFK